MGSLAPSSAWPSLDKGYRRRFGGAALLSVLGHVLLSPIPLLLGLATWFLERPVDEPAVDEIPIEFLGVETIEPDVPVPPPQPVDVGPSADSVTAPSPKVLAVKDPLAAKEQKEPKAPTAPPPQPASGLVDPVALAGDAGKLADSNANVRALLYTDRIREHAFGPEIGRLLRRAPQWSDFFGGANVDPIFDLDRILVAGPSLRNSSNIVAVIQHHLPQETIESAFQALVSRGGEFLQKEPLLVRAEADRAERLFAAPNQHIVVVSPPSAAASIKKLKKNLKFPPGPSGVAVQLYVKDLTKLLGLFGIAAPKTLSTARAEVRATESGGARIDITLDDSDKEHRSEHADELETLVRRATKIDFRRMGALGALAALAFGGQEKTFVEEVEFGVKGEHIVGTLSLTREQLRTLLDFADAALPPLSSVRPTPISPQPPVPDAPEPLAPESPDQLERLSAPKSGLAEPPEPLAPESPEPGSTQPPSDPGPEGNLAPAPDEREVAPIPSPSDGPGPTNPP